MTRYIGLDAHSESCTIAVLGGSGKRLRHERLQTSAELLKSFIKEVPRPRHLCMEEGTLSEWLCEELTPLVDKLVVVMPDRNPGNKSDLIDACKLADDLRRDAIRRPVYKAPGCFRALREAARTHYVLQRDKVRTKSRLSALCRGCGRPELAKALYGSNTRPDALQELPEHLRPRAALFGQELDALVECAVQAERSLQEESGRVPIVRRLATAPGIGVVRAAYIVAVVMTPHRFRTARQCRGMPGSPPSPSAAATNPGCTGATLARRFSARPSSNGSARPSHDLSGQRPSTRRAEPAARAIRPRSVPSPSSGFESFTAAGSTASPTTSRAT